MVSLSQEISIETPRITNNGQFKSGDSIETPRITNMVNFPRCMPTTMLGRRGKGRLKEQQNKQNCTASTTY